MKYALILLASLIVSGDCWSMGDHPPTVPGLTGWEQSRVYPSWQFFYRDGKLQEAWNPKTGERLLYREGNYWETITPDMARDGTIPPSRNEGIDRAELARSPNGYRLHKGDTTRELTREEALDIVSADSDLLPNDRGRPWLVVIGDPAFLGKVAADLDRSGLKTLVRYQGYTPDFWRAKQIDLSGSPEYQRSKTAILVATADGVIAHGQFDYRGAADLQLIEQKIDPSRIPDWRIPERVGEGVADQLWNKVKNEPVIWIGGAILLFLLLRKNN